MAGLSLQQLSDSLSREVTKQALSKYEMGLMKPNSNLLFKIAKALSVKPDYFLQQGILDLGKISFRKKGSLPKGVEDAIVERARDYVERYLELEDMIGSKHQFENPLVDTPIDNKADIKKAAQILREIWKLGNGPISSIVEILELKGIKVQLISDSDDFDGFAANSMNQIPVVVVNTAGRFVERVRFTIIHELAHIILNLSSSIKADNKLTEEYCHYFSSCFLLPEEAIYERLGVGKRSYIVIRELIHLKEQFGISLRAIVHRLRTEGVISDTYYRRWMIYMSKTYGSKNEPGAFKGQEHNVLFNMMIDRALSEGIISFSKAASLANTTIDEIRTNYQGVK